jgi:predicted Fe-Mo cluster-binding NifX family protein
MKLAVSTAENHLDSIIEPRFGRCGCFLIVDSEDMSYQAYPNENGALSGGAGIQSAQFIASKGAQVLITGNCGPNAMQTLSAAGIKVILGQGGTVREAVERFKRGELKSATEANVAEHYGTGGGFELGRGGGMGRGLGMGRRAGGGSGMTNRKGTVPLSRKEELNLLKDYAEGVKKELEQIQDRIRTLEKEISSE